MEKGLIEYTAYTQLSLKITYKLFFVVFISFFPIIISINKRANHKHYCSY